MDLAKRSRKEGQNLQEAYKFVMLKLRTYENDDAVGMQSEVCVPKIIQSGGKIHMVPKLHEMHFANMQNKLYSSSVSYFVPAVSAAKALLNTFNGTHYPIKRYQLELFSPFIKRSWAH